MSVETGVKVEGRVVTPNEIMEAVKEFHAIHAQKSADALQKVANIEKLFEKIDEKNAEVVSELAAKRKSEAEFADKISSIEKLLVRMPSGELKEKAEHVEAFKKFIKFGDKELNIEEKKYLRTDINPDGGYLVPPDYVTEIGKKITEISPIRQVARVTPTSSSSVQLPLRGQNVTVYWTAEGRTMTETQEQYELLEIPVNKMTALIRCTIEQLNDAAFNMESEINADVAEAIAQFEGYYFINGNGAKQPQGILSNADIEYIPSGVSGGINYNSMVDLQSSLKVGYNPMFMLNRKSLGAVRKIVSDDGLPLWTPYLSTANPSTILGEPYVLAPDLPDIAANDFPILYGDFYRGYRIVDNMQMLAKRDDTTEFDKGIIRFMFLKRTGGNVYISEAIKKMKIATS